jgi:hypothetical protein
MALESQASRRGAARRARWPKPAVVLPAVRPAAQGRTSANGAGASATVCCMTAKEKLRMTVDDLSEAEAQDTLGFIVRRRGQRDALGELLERAPLDDEPTTPEEDESAREARAEIARGEVLSADEIRRQVA